MRRVCIWLLVLPAGFACAQDDPADPFHGQLVPADQVARDGLGNRHFGVSASMAEGPFVLRAAHQLRNATDTATVMSAGNNYDDRSSILAANWRLPHATAFLAYGVNKGMGHLTLWDPERPYDAAVAGPPSARSRSLQLGVSVPVGKVSLIAAAIRKHDQEPLMVDTSQIAFGMSYLVSPNTDWYVAAAHSQDRVGRSLSIGLRHAF